MIFKIYIKGLHICVYLRDYLINNGIRLLSYYAVLYYTCCAIIFLYHLCSITTIKIMCRTVRYNETLM